jgi:hypothetical protein
VPTSTGLARAGAWREGRGGSNRGKGGFGQRGGAAGGRGRVAGGEHAPAAPRPRPRPCSGTGPPQSRATGEGRMREATPWSVDGRGPRGMQEGDSDGSTRFPWTGRRAVETCRWAWSAVVRSRGGAVTVKRSETVHGEVVRKQENLLSEGLDPREGRGRSASRCLAWIQHACSCLPWSPIPR